MLSSQAGSGRIAGACVQKAFSGQFLLRLEGKMFGVGFKLRRPPAKQQGPGSQRQPRPSLAYGDQMDRVEYASVALLSKGALGLWFVPRGESPFPECSSQNLVLSRE